MHTYGADEYYGPDSSLVVSAMLANGDRNDDNDRGDDGGVGDRVDNKRRRYTAHSVDAAYSSMISSENTENTKECCCDCPVLPSARQYPCLCLGFCSLRCTTQINPWPARFAQGKISTVYTFTSLSTISTIHN